MNNYEKYPSSPEMLEKLLKEVATKAEKPWEIAFNRIFCDECEHDTGPDVCPHEEYRDNPGWWLGLEAGICMLTKKGEKIGWYSQYKKEDLVNKLGPIEHEAEGILEQICEKRCAFRRPPLLPENQEDMDAICEDCPMNRLAQLIGV